MNQLEDPFILPPGMADPPISDWPVSGPALLAAIARTREWAEGEANTLRLKCIYADHLEKLLQIERDRAAMPPRPRVHPNATHEL